MVPMIAREVTGDHGGSTIIKYLWYSTHSMIGIDFVCYFCQPCDEYLGLLSDSTRACLDSNEAYRSVILPT